MKKRSLQISISQQPANYSINVASGLLADCGKWTRKCLDGDAEKIVIVSNPTVFKLYGGQTAESLRRAGFSVSHFLMRDGEKFKNFNSVESALKHFAEMRLSRTDGVIALGGGVVGDLAGFAAAVYLRGIRVLQIPTTLLAMIDSSVGGKTGVNSSFGKNLTGAFHQPSGVLIDVDVVRTLAERELTAGFCEMIKHGAISGKTLLDQTNSFLEKFPLNGLHTYFEIPTFRSEISDLISENVQFKAKIVVGDERESAKRLDARSRKILNFGHTLAHALEKVTDYKYFKHGEAVGYGILFAAELSKNLALCDEKVVKSLYDVMHRVGALPKIANIDPKEVLEAFRFDKKNVSGSLQMVLLKDIGKPIIMSERDIPRTSIQKVLKNLLQSRA